MTQRMSQQRDATTSTVCEYYQHPTCSTRLLPDLPAPFLIYQPLPDLSALILCLLYPHMECIRSGSSRVVCWIRIPYMLLAVAIIHHTSFSKRLNTDNLNIKSTPNHCKTQLIAFKQFFFRHFLAIGTRDRTLLTR